MSEKVFSRAAVLIKRQILPSRLLILALTLGMVGCSTSPHGSHSDNHSAPATPARLELNDGKKWKVPEPMMVHIRNLEKAVQDFGRTPGHDHAILATQIQNDLGRLVTSCTMVGEAHDNLHKWLMPFLGLTTDYSKATSPRVQQQKLTEIKHSLRVFHEYFE